MHRTFFGSVHGGALLLQPGNYKHIDNKVFQGSPSAMNLRRDSSCSQMPGHEKCKRGPVL
ncbi:hypothetical protein DES53_101265 [Roseimicrobium gellanilyticum]|uniref:Uncharacterized protein n=1 Tax=Roseimicrobium gellanilyticum TaxID=748857 RepID=A0A366HW03_9BACT|nr:hypothetical protein DES53_101265 [Roseimicrobium gellanilyticum]